ncbi:hypothetical protein [Haloglomus litoreum]|uniref:hypothetical protein n=1 Tax=Haloglomus litoreum TaxID=3034026 RepID=UPI0023E87A93|nr:hypothetical protein [Haloglomus sp. DT116]
MSIERHLRGDESVHARYDGDWVWYCTDQRVLRVPAATADAAPETLPYDEVERVGRVAGRDTRYLVAALSAVLLATLVPALLMGVANVAVVPASAVAGGFAVLAVLGFYRWLDSNEPYYQFQGTAGLAATDDWRLPDDEDAAAFVETVRLRL